MLMGEVERDGVILRLFGIVAESCEQQVSNRTQFCSILSNFQISGAQK